MRTLGRINPEAAARRNRQKPAKGTKMVKHTLVDEVMINAEATAQLPRRMCGEEVVFLANICTDRTFVGVALVIARPKNPVLTPDDWNWDYPAFADDWEIVGDRPISYKHCKKIQKCSNVISLLEKHFNDKGYSTFGWELLYNDNHKLNGLLIRDFRQKPKLKTA